jgi:polyisoprenoid-binding protein YceI
MNRLLFILPLFMASCMGKYQSNAPEVIVNPATEQIADVVADTIQVDLQNSKIEWVATKMRGTRKRTGTISFQYGHLLMQNGEIIGGTLIVDMESITVTDIPISEDIARKNLLDHLKSEDFFNVADFPVATLTMTKVHRISEDRLECSGNLSIREITKNITFEARHQGRRFSTIFKFNRFDWKIAYQGSWADKTLVDKEVELSIEVVIQ